MYKEATILCDLDSCFPALLLLRMPSTLTGDLAGHGARATAVCIYMAGFKINTMTDRRADLSRRGAILNRENAYSEHDGWLHCQHPFPSSSYTRHINRRRSRPKSKPRGINITRHTKRAAPHAARTNGSQCWPACVWSNGARVPTDATVEPHRPSRPAQVAALRGHWPAANCIYGWYCCIRTL